MATKAIATGDPIYPVGRKKESAEAGNVLYRLLRSDVLTDTVAAFFLSSGICLALLPLTILDGGVWNTLCLVGAVVLMLAVLRIRWWMGPTLAILLFGGMALYYYRLEQLSERIAYWMAIAVWILQGSPYHEIFSESPSLVLLKYAMICGVSWALFLILRRFFSILLLLALFGGVMVAVDLAGNVALIVPVGFFAVGLIILLPRVFARQLQKHGNDDRHRRASMQVVAIPGAVLIVLAAMWITPDNTAGWRSIKISNFFYDIGRLFEGPIEIHSEGATNFDLSVLGMQQSEGRLGGPARLPDWHMLTVVTEHPVLLRGAVMDTYTGSQWIAGRAEGEFRYVGLFGREYRALVFDGEMPLGGPEAEALYEQLSTEITMQITYETQYYTTLFTTGQVQEITFTTPSLQQNAFFNLRSELYLTSLVPEKETVTVRTRVLDAQDARNKQDFLRLEQLAATEWEERSQQVAARYTVLPEDLPDSVREAAWDAVEGTETPYAQVWAIAEYIADRCTYTLNPQMPPDGVDFVDYFLQTGEGYCTYYASAMAVMARVVGIPARYVTGFALERDFSRENTYYATGKTAHAWTEIYLSGIGWVTIDPLNWNADDPLNRDLEQGDAYRWYGPFEEEEEEYYDIYGLWYEFNLMDDETTLDLRIVAGALGGALLLGLIVYLSICWNSKYRAYTLRRVLRRYRGAPERFAFYYDDIMRQHALLGCEPQPGETLLRYPVRVDKRMGAEAGGFAPIAAVRMKLYFAEQEPTPTELEAADRYHRFLEDSLRGNLSKISYLLKRATKRNRRRE